MKQEFIYNRNTMPASFKDIISERRGRLYTQYLDICLYRYFLDSKQLRSIIAGTSPDITTDKDYIDEIHKKFTIINRSKANYNEVPRILLMPKDVRISSPINVDLTDYWNDVIEIEPNKLTAKEIGHKELVYLDYVNGQARLRDKIEQDITNYDFDVIPDELQIADEYKLN